MSFSNLDDVRAFIEKLKVLLAKEQTITPREYEEIHKEFGDFINYMEKDLDSSES